MPDFIAGLFLILHGLVHLLYFGQSWRTFTLQPNLTWPDGSWAFSRWLSQAAGRRLAGIACLLAAIAFATGGIAFWAGQTWWQPVITASAVVSTLIFLLFWNGKMQRLPDQGIVAIIINLAILSFLFIME